MLRLIDSHAHTQFPAYDGDRDEVIGRALDAGVGIINVGTQYSTSVDAVNLARRYSYGVWATAGFHPGHLGPDAHHDPKELRERESEEFEYEKFLALVREREVIAVGECGLDYYRIGGAGPEITERQKFIFCRQIELAAKAGKPLVIHCRQAFADLIAILKSKPELLNSPAGVVHFFSGSWEDAEELLGLGFYLGFGGVITFTRDYDEVARKAPLERILVETDAPYVAPVPYRGQRNEPLYARETAGRIAELRAISSEEVAAQTTANANELFGLG